MKKENNKKPASLVSLFSDFDQSTIFEEAIKQKTEVFEVDGKKTKIVVKMQQNKSPPILFIKKN